jgi:putative endonuclease
MPSDQRSYYVYILASKSRVLYVGITSRLWARVREHRSGEFGGFTSDYRVHRLVHFECFQWVDSAIRREKQIKRWRRDKKVALIERENPTWEDLSAEWGKPVYLQMRTPESV